MRLKDIMKRDVITARDTDRLGDLQRTMTSAHIRHLPVLRGGQLVGMLSERDILDYRAKLDLGEDWWRATAALAMRAPVHTGCPDDTVIEAAGRMASGRLGALPIVDDGHLVGLVTATDLLAADASVPLE